MGIKVEAAALSNIGGRRNNEDNFFLNGSYMPRDRMNEGDRLSASSAAPVQLYAVFDGMGGGDMGEFASCYASEQLKAYQEKSEHVDNSDNLRTFLTRTSKGIDKMSLDNGLRSGSCGSTAAILVIGDWWYRTAHVGDSRIYLLRDGELRRITKDQSEVQRLVDAGKLTPDEAFSHPRKNVITHHLGMPLRGGDLQSIIGERMPLQVGDCFLVCSDGLSDNLRDREIKELFSPTRSAEENAACLVQQALQHAKAMGIESDNVTAVVVRIEQVADSDAAPRRLRGMKLRRTLCIVAAALCGSGALFAILMLVGLLVA